MYGPPPNCKRFDVDRMDCPRKCSGSGVNDLDPPASFHLVVGWAGNPGDHGYSPSGCDCAAGKRSFGGKHREKSQTSQVFAVLALQGPKVLLRNRRAVLENWASVAHSSMGLRNLGRPIRSASMTCLNIATFWATVQQLDVPFISTRARCWLPAASRTCAPKQ